VASIVGLSGGVGYVAIEDFVNGIHEHLLEGVAIFAKVGDRLLAYDDVGLEIIFRRVAHEKKRWGYLGVAILQ
jgi:hypothetical protein